MTKDRRKRKTTILLLAVLLALVLLGSFLLWSFLPEEVRQGEAVPPAAPAEESVEQEEPAVQSEGVVKLCYCVPRERIQGLIGALEGLSLQVEPVPLAISFERSKIYISGGARRTEDVKNLLPHASVEGLTGENYDYIIYIGTDYQG